ncbi:hypothetical protein SAMN05216227_10472 [Pseudorhodobacter antarcticus]|jgi:hypothetical protein|uniref:Uncharacterized protein n=1 Tax=Pseudorhodobacter antarcticus TaxID=1077947 RepID=A0A1H8LY76_9RHOB|nr:hypothetical protein SAMN05216227_10472 [Pseudorhodobacter antarcticus]
MRTFGNQKQMYPSSAHQRFSSKNAASSMNGRSGEAAPQRTDGQPRSAVGGGFNRSTQHTLRTSLLGFGIARSCVAVR